MAEAFSQLYQGQLASSVATIATVPGSTQWVAKNILVVNTDTADRTAIFYRNGTTAAHQVSATLLVPAGGSVEWTINWGMAAGETIAAVGSVASKLTTTIDGLIIT